MPELVRNYPQKFDTYFEPFLGGGGAGSADIERMIGRRVENMTGIITLSYLVANVTTYAAAIITL